MKKFLKDLLSKRLNNEKGLTLIELLAVIVILAIIAAIAVPAIGNIINDSRDKAVLSEALNIISGAKLAYTNGDCDTDNICQGNEIGNYVDGVTLTSTTTVQLVNDNWTINGYDFSRLAANGDFAAIRTQTTGVTEEQLKAAIDS